MKQTLAHSTLRSIIACVFVLAVASVVFADAPGSAPASVVVPANSRQIHYFGRFSFADPAAPRMWWPGSAIEVKFTGTAISAVIGDSTDANEFTAVLDGDSAHAQTITCAKGEQAYALASGLPQGQHVLLLWLRSETWQPVWFKEFLLSAGGKPDNLAAPKRKIEFFGDSITCGYGDEGTSTDQRTDANSDNFLSYGAVTARALNAEYRCTARSGIAITTSWNDPPSSGLMMPNYYDRLDPNVEHSWDFKLWTPDAVVINLGENDSGIYKMGRHPDPGPDADTTAYKQFVATIRGVYPKAMIFCVLGPMDAVRGPWKDYEANAVKQLNDAGDKRIYFLPLDVRTGPTLSGPGNHPNIAEHQAMANLLMPFIASHMGWQ